MFVQVAVKTLRCSHTGRLLCQRGAEKVGCVIELFP